MNPHDPTPAAGAVGSALAAARVASGRSVTDVASALRVREAVVEGIEADDYALCGGDVYARGHVRSYARLLGLDDGPLLQAFADRGAQAGPARPAARGRRRDRGAALHGPVPPLPATSRRRLERRVGVPWAALGSVAIVGVVGLIGVELVGALRAPARPAHEVAAPVRDRPRTAATTATPGAVGSAAAARPAPRTSSSARPPARRAVPAPTATPDRRVKIALRATGDSWVTVRGKSGRTKFAGVLGKGDRKRFTDDEGLRVLLGNAGGVQLTVNGRSVGAAGREGEVKRLTIRPRDPA
jgi:cytoskeleton protein RodZ